MILNQEQNARLQTLQSTGVVTGNFAAAYHYLEVVALSQGDAPLANWFNRAASINGNDGSWTSEFVRGTTKAAGFVNGKPITDSDFQFASNLLASNVIGDALAGRITGASFVLTKDVNSAVQDLGLSSYQWAGTWGDSLPVSMGGLGQDYMTLPTKSWSDYAGAWFKSGISNGAGAVQASLGSSALLQAVVDQFMVHDSSPVIITTPVSASGSKTTFTVNAHNSTLTASETSASGTLLGGARTQFMDNKTITTRLNAKLEPTDTVSIYTVNAGDTLTSIAQKNNTTVSILQAYNQQITDPGKILAGEKIAIPLAVHNIGNTWTVGTGATGDLITAATGSTLTELQILNPGINVLNPPVGTVLNLPTPQQKLLVSTTTIAPNFSVTQTGTANEGAAAAAVQNGVAVGSSVKTVSFSNGELNSTSAYNTLISSIATDGIRPGNFSTLINGISTPVPSLLISNPAQNTTISVPNQSTTGGSNYTVNNYGVIIPNILNSNRTYVDPLILDLNNDGVQLTSYADKTVLFDIDHDGLTAGKVTLEQTGWVKANTTTGQTHNTDGIVVHDLNGNGKIDGIHETLSEFYNGAAGSNGNAGEKKYSNGFTALKSLDTGNGTIGSAGYGDNVFDNKDAAYTQLRVWIDANADGVTDAGELKTLTELNITSINLAATAQSGLVNGGNEILATGTFTQTVNGSSQTKQAQAINFVANTAGSSFTNVTGGVVIDTQAGETGLTTSTYTHTGSNNATLSTTTLNVKNIYGNTGNDTITGDANANWLGGGAGADNINAGAGDDVLLIDANDTSIDGGDGNDIAQVIGDAGVTLNLAQSHIEAVVGGRGNDILIGGGRSSVFISANDGDDIVIGGAANDVLSGENGSDLVDGGAGNDLMRGGRGRDQLIGGSGDDILDGGQDDDNLNGGDGNDVLTGGQGDDQLDGGSGSDVAEFSGSYADYRVTKVASNTYRVTDLLGRDGTDTLSNIEKLSFKDVSWVDPDLASPLPVKDILDVNSTGVALSRTGVQIISKAQLLGNDIDRQSDVLSINAVSDFQGGTALINANGDVQFTPDANYKGIMGFKYSVKDAANNTTQVSLNGATAAMKAAVYLRTPDIPKDPLAVDQWYLSEANIIPVWQDYTGKGIKIAQFEPGGEFSVGPEILDTTHPDLKPNLDASWLANPNSNIPQTYSNHATMVAGVIVGARNGEGGVGVAYDAQISGHYIQGSGITVTALEQEITNALATFKNYDVVNNSWGSASNFDINVVPVGLLQRGILDAVENGRNGLGTVIVMAGGNDRQTGGNTNTSALTGNRAVIVVGGINAASDLGSLQIGGTPFSNPGASILVSAPASNITASSRLIETSNGSTFGSDYSATQGTSFATPIISGIVALMLEANPKLGWRDVQQILAITAKKVNDPNTDTVWNNANNWNGGGMHTSHDYGFGEVDAMAAVRLAESWIVGGSHTSLNERHLVNGEGSVNGADDLNIAISDGATITRSLAIGAGLRVEHATVSIDINHSNWGDLTVELISPTGTVSKLIANPGSHSGNLGGEKGNGKLNFALDTTHTFGENAQGNWQLKITDRTEGGAGTLYGWKVDVYGSDFNETYYSRDVVIGETPVISGVADNSYYFTDEFATAPGTTRTTINDTNNGIDTINASAVSTGVNINLSGTTTSKIAGRDLNLVGTIEHAFGGDGVDAIFGNALNNHLNGGRGDDLLYGLDGNDYLDGGLGADSIDGGIGNDTLVFGDDIGYLNYDTKIVQYGVVGGLGADIFKFKNSVGTVNINSVQSISGVLYYVSNNLISDFEVDKDVIDLRAYSSVTNFTNLVIRQNFTNTSSNFVTEVKLGTALDAPTIHLHKVPVGSLSASNFIFANSTVVNPVTPPVLVGDSGGNLLNGTSGADMLEGRTGDDTYIVDNADDKVDEFTGGGYDAVESSVTHILAKNVEQLTLTGTGLINGIGNDDANRIVGNSANNTLDGKAGSDDLRGGAGSDTYIVDTGTDRITENVNEGTDIVQSSVSWTLGKNLENLTLTGFDNINATGNELVNTLIGNAADNILDGAQGADNLQGGAGNDTYYVDNASDGIAESAASGYDTVYSSVTFSLNATAGRKQVEQLILAIGATEGTGNALDNVLVGNDVSNKLTGLAGTDYLDGGAGVDTLVGGAGDDTYVVDVIKSGTVAVLQDTMTEIANDGADTLQLRTNSDLALSAATTLTLATNLENLNISATGSNKLNITGNGAANTLVGNAANNVLQGLVGNDYLDGGLGADAMSGGTEDDTYIIDNIGDVVTEAAGQGTDAVISSIAFNLTTAGANVENLTLTGFDSINATGNGLANTLIGNAGNNILDGAAGTDQLKGGAGDDTYLVDSDDVITELANQGVDTVIAGFTYTLGNNLENLTLTGTAAINGTGNDLNNIITGNAAANILDGGNGYNTLIGGTGKDTYVIQLESHEDYQNSTLVDNVIFEDDGGAGDIDTIRFEGNNESYYSGGFAYRQSNDLIFKQFYNGIGPWDYQNESYTTVKNYFLGARYQIENIIEYGTQSTVSDLLAKGYDYVGTDADEVMISDGYTRLIGNRGNDTLIGSAKADSMSGNSGNDVLDGGLGNDTMYGGYGDDTYTIDVLADQTNEDASSGNDTVKVAIATVNGTYTLAANVENATLTNTVAYNLTGNALANFMRGNAANNTLTDTAGGNDILQGLAGIDIFNDTVGNNVFDGGIGADIMTGGAGREIFIGGKDNDTVTTGTGYDVIVFNKGDGQDTINASTGADNTISLGGNFAYSDLSLTKSTNNLIIKMGASNQTTSDQITLKDWYSSSPNNKSVINLQVIAEAMQGFSQGGSDQLRNNKVENFNFTNLVAAFDSAGATANWQLTDARLTTHLKAGSDTAAMGGDLAYQYGKNSNLTGMGLSNAQTVIGATSFGQTAQTLNNPTAWQAEVIKLG